MIRTVHIILLDRGTSSIVNRVHAAIKTHASGWWHQLRHAWIVGGDRTAAEWRDLLHESVKGTGANILVVELPAEDAQRKWSYFGTQPKKRCRWLHDNYR